MNETLPSADMIGPYGRAWRYDIDAIARAHADKPHSSVISWLIEARMAHPVWHSYNLNLIHLREVPNLAPAKIYLPGATHEINLFALDPRKAHDLKTEPAWLFPLNFAAQLIADSDAAAVARVNDTVSEIVVGRLSPDTDHLQSWIMRYGNNMVKGDSSKAGQTRIVISEPGKQSTDIVIAPQPAQAPHS